MSAEQSSDQLVEQGMVRGDISNTPHWLPLSSGHIDVWSNETIVVHISDPDTFETLHT